MNEKLKFESRIRELEEHYKKFVFDFMRIFENYRVSIELTIYNNLMSDANLYL